MTEPATAAPATEPAARSFPLPSEITDVPGAEQWRTMYPYFTRFQTEDDRRFWCFPRGIADEEFLLRATMPGEQVDAMLAAGPVRHRYNPDLEPVLDLLRALRNRPRIAELVVESGDLRVELRR